MPLPLPLPFRRWCVSLLCFGSLATAPVLAQEEAEPDPDAVTKIDPSPRNPDMIRATTAAGQRVRHAAGRTTVASPPENNPPAPSLSERDLRMFAARGIGPTVNICSVVQNGGGGAQAPVVSTRIDIDCSVGNVVVGRR